MSSHMRSRWDLMSQIFLLNRKWLMRSHMRSHMRYNVWNSYKDLIWDLILYFHAGSICQSSNYYNTRNIYEIQKLAFTVTYIMASYTVIFTEQMAPLKHLAPLTMNQWLIILFSTLGFDEVYTIETPWINIPSLSHILKN